MPREWAVAVGNGAGVGRWLRRCRGLGRGRGHRRCRRLRRGCRLWRMGGLGSGRGLLRWLLHGFLARFFRCFFRWFLSGFFGGFLHRKHPLEAGAWAFTAAATAASMVAWMLGVGGGTGVGVLSGVTVGWAWQAAMMVAAIRIRGRKSIAFSGRGRDSRREVALMYSKMGYTPGSYSGPGRRGHPYRL